MLTCPHCRALVNYSCLCEMPEQEKDYIRHDSVEAAKLWVADARAEDPLPSPTPEG